MQAGTTQSGVRSVAGDCGQPGQDNKGRAVCHLAIQGRGANPLHLGQQGFSFFPEKLTPLFFPILGPLLAIVKATGVGSPSPSVPAHCQSVLSNATLPEEKIPPPYILGLLAIDEALAAVKLICGRRIIDAPSVGRDPHGLSWQLSAWHTHIHSALTTQMSASIALHCSPPNEQVRLAVHSWPLPKAHFCPQRLTNNRQFPESAPQPSSIYFSRISALTTFSKNFPIFLLQRTHTHSHHRQQRLFQQCFNSQQQTHIQFSQIFFIHLRTPQQRLGLFVCFSSNNPRSRSTSSSAAPPPLRVTAPAAEYSFQWLCLLSEAAATIIPSEPSAALITRRLLIEKKSSSSSTES